MNFWTAQEGLTRPWFSGAQDSLHVSEMISVFISHSFCTLCACFVFREFHLICAAMNIALTDAAVKLSFLGVIQVLILEVC